MNQEVNQQSKVNSIDYYSNPSPRGETCIYGTSSYGTTVSSNGYEKCPFYDPELNPHWIHADKNTIQTLSEQGKDRDGYIIANITSIGNTLVDFVYHTNANIARLFKKLDEILSVISGLPTKNEKDNAKADDKQLLNLVKLLCQKQGMSEEEIAKLRPPVNKIEDGT